MFPGAPVIVTLVVNERFFVHEKLLQKPEWGGSLKPVFNIYPPAAPWCPSHTHMGPLGWRDHLDDIHGTQFPPYLGR